MGNQCCFLVGNNDKSRRSAAYRIPDKVPSNDLNDELLTRSKSVIQHINEREPDDATYDPSVMPQATPLFARPSHSNTFRTRSTVSVTKPPGYEEFNCKSNSCSTIHLGDSTASQPNKKFILKAVALAIYCHLKSATKKPQSERNGCRQLYVLFDEMLQPVCDSPSLDYKRQIPDFKTIYKFLRVLFDYAQMTAECAIITLVYLERLVVYGELDLTPQYWRRMVLGCVLLASKVWDDQAVWNIDFCTFLRKVTVDQMNELERGMLELVNFNINVPQSVYVKYYFDLRELARSKGLILPVAPLTKKRALEFDAAAIRTVGFVPRLTKSENNFESPLRSIAIS